MTKNKKRKKEITGHGKTLPDAIWSPQWDNEGLPLGEGNRWVSYNGDKK